MSKKSNLLMDLFLAALLLASLLLVWLKRPLRPGSLLPNQKVVQVPPPVVEDDNLSAPTK